MAKKSEKVIRQPLRVLLVGSAGRMGEEVIRTLAHEKDLVLAGAVDPATAAKPAAPGVLTRATVAEALAKDGPFDVALDLTNPEALMHNAPGIIKAGVPLVVGTSGNDAPRLKRLQKLVAGHPQSAVWVVPNFAVGAVLMMRFAEMAARVMPHVEIVEYHHDRKQDYPSGTALATAGRLLKANPKLRMDSPDRVAHLEGARGGALGNVKIHAVRLPGYVASQEVLFGGTAQVLKIRHDTLHREAFMPGVMLALRHGATLRGFHMGLELALGV